ncbi:MAG: 2-polyprenyl-3-methyl-6-methoxy-1,4-benzoquinone monooxygenase [Legionellaceae bacterium]|nr:2-polyprenyl-3-methyl-6-methoxy-1,4-benzoquinone monooxygenase [Legionellaceae bacterium]
MRHLSLIDQLLGKVDTALRTVCIPKQRTSNRASPANNLTDVSLDAPTKRHVAGLMRVNHAGEVCAQALYQGQAATAKLDEVKAQMTAAADEEIDHLAWCEERLCELESRPSVLNPLWYMGSFMLGALAGVAGDRWSLGFVAETERQVTSHLQQHRQHVPAEDVKTQAILAKMQDDESQHAQAATDAGAAELPFVVRQLMRGASKLLTFSSYYI